MPLYGDKGKVIFANIVARMWQDPAFEKQFHENPKAALAADGIVLPEGIDLNLLQNTDKIHYVKLPYRPDPTQAIADIHMRAPYIAIIPDGHEVRLVRDSQHRVNVVLPHKPEGFNPAAMSHDALAAAVVAMDSSANINQNVNVNANVNAQVNVNGGVNANVGAVDVGVVVVVT
jgi:hypothetical protein